MLYTGYGMFYFNFAGIGFVIIAAVISMFAQSYVNSSYRKFSKVSTIEGVTGAEMARKILAMHDIQDVEVVMSKKGILSDHYDPQKKIVALSPDIYNKSTVAAVAVASHEVGHAIQHAQSYGFIGLRNRILPVAIVGNQFGMIAVMIGLFSGSENFFWFGIIALSMMALFQLVTLPVEFDASKRALKILGSNNLVSDNELGGCKTMLTAAALTYVAALLSTILNLLRLVAVFNSNRD